ncbi:MAG: hypothetical protein ABFD54_14275 [Armatimonadota bacterium]|nr:hypothetical protein [bacterium]
MKIVRLCMLFAIVFVLSSGYMCHAQKTTIDPNIGRTSYQNTDDVLDTRMAKKVTYEAWHTPLRTILEEISESTGVTLIAGYNKNDWQVRDRRMNIYVKDVTLAQLMNSISRVMKFKWHKNDDVTPPVYRLCADRRLIGELQTKASQLEKELKKEEVKRRTGLVDALANVANMSGADIEALKESNPYLYQCAQTGFAKAMTDIFADEPRLREAFVNGDRTASVDANLFSPSTQQSCTSTMRNCWPLDHITMNRVPIADNLEDSFPQHGINFDWLTKPYERSQRKRLFYYGYIVGIAADGGHFMGDMRDPYAKASKEWGKACVEAVEQQIAPGENWSKLAPQYFPTETEEAKDIEKYFMADPVVEHPDEDALHKTISLKISDEAEKALVEEIKATGGRAYPRLVYQALQKAFADAAEMGIVSDSYAVVLSNNTKDIPDKDELVVILDKFTDLYRCNWEKHSSVLEFRRLDWFRRRSSQVPDEWIMPWRDELEKKGVLSLENYIRMVALTDDQLEENVNSDPLLDQALGDYWTVGTIKGFCRFYVQLSESQRGMLFSEMGLDVRMLNPAQWQYYSDMFELGWQNKWRTEEFSNPSSAPVTIKANSETEKDGGATYKFTVSLKSDDGSPKEQCWNIKLRKIQLPQDEKDKLVGGK